MNIRITIGTGKTKDGNVIHPRTRDLVLDQIRRHAALAFGGWTESAARGGWVDDQGNVVTESVVVFDIAVTAPFRGLHQDHINTIVQLAKDELHQACVLVQFLHGESTIS